jgi:hypothetical protein
MKRLLLAWCLAFCCAETYAQTVWVPASPVYATSVYPSYYYAPTYYGENRPIVYYSGQVFGYVQYVHYVPVAPVYPVYPVAPPVYVPAATLYQVPSAAPRCRLFRY